MEEERGKPTCTVDYFELIEELFQNKPKKSSKEYREWVEEINRLIEECNIFAKREVYKPIKNVLGRNKTDKRRVIHDVVPESIVHGSALGDQDIPTGISETESND